MPALGEPATGSAARELPPARRQTPWPHRERNTTIDRGRPHAVSPSVRIRIPRPVSLHVIPAGHGAIVLPLPGYHRWQGGMPGGRTLPSLHLFGTMPAARVASGTLRRLTPTPMHAPVVGAPQPARARGQPAAPSGWPETLGALATTAATACSVIGSTAGGSGFGSGTLPLAALLPVLIWERVRHRLLLRPTGVVLSNLVPPG
jgi:hypothetical protein